MTYAELHRAISTAINQAMDNVEDRLFRTYIRAHMAALEAKRQALTLASFDDRDWATAEQLRIQIEDLSQRYGLAKPGA